VDHAEELAEIVTRQVGVDDLDGTGGLASALVGERATSSTRQPR